MGHWLLFVDLNLISGSDQTKVGQGGGVWTPCLFPCDRHETCSVLHLHALLVSSGTKQQHLLHYVQTIDFSYTFAHFLLSKSQLMCVLHRLPHFMLIHASKRLPAAEVSRSTRNKLKEQCRTKRIPPSCQISNESVALI
jgi:hypothetical protein